MRNVSDKSCRENYNTHFIFNNFFVKKKMVEPHSTSDYLKRSMRIASWISKATNTRSQFLTTSILLQQRFNGFTLHLRCPSVYFCYWYIISFWNHIRGVLHCKWFRN